MVWKLFHVWQSNDTNKEMFLKFGWMSTLYHCFPFQAVALVTAHSLGSSLKDITVNETDDSEGLWNGREIHGPDDERVSEAIKKTHAVRRNDP